MSLNLLFANLISVLIFFILYKNKNFITKKFNLIDHPDNNRKLHQTKTPLIGGLLIFVCVVYLIAVDQLFIINTNFIAKIITILLPIFKDFFKLCVCLFFKFFFSRRWGFLRY